MSTTGEERATDGDRALLDGAMHSVWLHGDWRRLTLHMTTDEKEAAADAVDRHSALIEPGDPVACLRWWRGGTEGGDASSDAGRRSSCGAGGQ